LQWAPHLTPDPPVDLRLSIDYDLATRVGLFRFSPLLFFLGSGLKLFTSYQILRPCQACCLFACCFGQTHSDSCPKVP